MAYCGQCGRKNHEEAIYCSNCGEKISIPSRIEQEEKEILVSEIESEEENIGEETEKEEKPKKLDSTSEEQETNQEIPWYKKHLKILFIMVTSVCIVILFLVFNSYGTPAQPNTKTKQNYSQITPPQSYSLNNKSPEEWLKTNQSVLDVIMQNQVNLTQANVHYIYYLQSRDLTIFDRMIDKAQNAQQKIKENTNNEETEKIRHEVNIHLMGQIDAFKFYKACILGNKTEGEYRTGLRYLYVWQYPITDRTSSLGIILNKYGIDATEMFKKAS